MAEAKEFVVEQPDGSFDDAEAHASILDNDQAGRAVLELTRKRLIEAGEDPAVVDELYPLD